MILDGQQNLVTDIEWLEAELYNFVSFDDAAPQIDESWTRHNLHKELTEGRILKSQILIVEDKELFGKESFNFGKKYFLHKDEIQRLKEDVSKRPKRKHKRCEWCGRILHYCDARPCERRYRATPEGQQSLTETAEFIERWVKKAERASRETGKFYRKFKFGGRRVGHNK